MVKLLKVLAVVWEEHLLLPCTNQTNQLKEEWGSQQWIHLRKFGITDSKKKQL